ncbi:hypothetical protein P3T37_002119 [Kitasatospora sp. MAA4]|uniref:hypothetical protein n=1 Tax=Kitasatospora sp. MAA4 TaxID=3035093 RepID=UPI00247419C1|nr:hypothetical protein [Kitasatospora sp. MAA4]MDH6132733.1 hypothetical protein [Kitasatospora sp. MAA4]
MPTHSSSALPAAGPLHAAPDRDRVTFLTASWAALNVATACLLGFAVHQTEAHPLAAQAATTPDLPIV